MTETPIMDWWRLSCVSHDSFACVAQVWHGQWRVFGSRRSPTCSQLPLYHSPPPFPLSFSVSHTKYTLRSRRGSTRVHSLLALPTGPSSISLRPLLLVRINVLLTILRLLCWKAILSGIKVTPLFVSMVLVILFTAFITVRKLGVLRFLSRFVWATRLTLLNFRTLRANTILDRGDVVYLYTIVQRRTP